MYFETAKQKFEQLKSKPHITILAIESSCDETSVAIIYDGRKILSNIIASQIPIHERFGGVVPEVASRNHITAINNVCEEALEKANVTLEDIDAIAVTYGAGLIGALLVGVNFAKALAYSLNIPLIAVSHIEGHISANYLTHQDLEPPFVCLMMSGGHTAILNVDDYCHHTLVATTVDDAVGEAFDKVARVVGLGYPGGPKVDNLAKEGEPNIKFLQKGIMTTSKDFSFSGLKTAVINYIHKEQQNGNEIKCADVCASFQKAVADELIPKTQKAVRNSGTKKLVLAGGVSANSYLKSRFEEDSKKEGYKLFHPKLILSTDNAAMIGSAAYYMIKKGQGLADLDLTAQSVVKLDS